jgi:hypothetical protein
VATRAREIRQDGRQRRSFPCAAAGHGRPYEVEEGLEVWVPHVSDGAEETTGLEGMCGK